MKHLITYLKTILNIASEKIGSIKPTNINYNMALLKVGK